MARTSAKAKKPPRKECENNSTENNGPKEELEQNKSGSKITGDSVEHLKENDDLNYEVDKIIDCQESGGKTQYLVRWKGFKEDEDTWENESVLKSCGESLAAFKQRNVQCYNRKKKSKRANIEKNKSLMKKVNKSQRHCSLSDAERIKNKRKPAKRAKGSSRKKFKNDNKKTRKECFDNYNSASDIESTDGVNYEVEKIIEMRVKRNGSREFLIRWKGYNPGQDTWEPETHLNCQDMITRFTEQVKDIKETEIDKSKNTKTAVPVSKNDDH